MECMGFYIEKERFKMEFKWLNESAINKTGG